MFLFASRPLDTYFSERPTGWYFYHWEIDTHPEFVEFGNAETLDAEQKAQFNDLLVTEKYSGVQAMNKTIFEEGIEKGEEKGRRAVLRELLEAKKELAKALLKAQSLADLGLDK